MVQLVDVSLVLLAALITAWRANAGVIRRQYIPPYLASITPLSDAEIASFRPFTFYASAAYCQPVQILNWTCGINCDANPTFQPVAAGGDGDEVQFWYVGYDPSRKMILVGHQGTDPQESKSVLTDINFLPSNLNETLFPGLPNTIQVHRGFAYEHAKTAPDIFSAVQKTMKGTGFNKVTVVGHSLGAALALLDSVYLPLHLPNVEIQMIGYGMPRVGNQAFATYVDNHVKLAHVNNKEDPIPSLPGRRLGFRHPQGEIHIQQDGSWLSCPGDDNADDSCTISDVVTVLAVVEAVVEGKLKVHDGPYDTVTMGC